MRNKEKVMMKIVLLGVVLIGFLVELEGFPIMLLAHEKVRGPYALPVELDGVDGSVKIDKDKGSTKRSFLSGFISSFSMILVSELGDKTFFIAAIMAMKNPRSVVFLGAASALFLMTIISVAFGYFLITWIPRVYTYYFSTALFGLFGIKMFYDGIKMSKEEENEDLEEVQNDILNRADDERSPLTGRGEQLPISVKKMLITLFSKVYLQTLMMTFIAEWGDRSQLATIVLAGRENVFAVCIGVILGHSLCTGVAVMGGRMIAQRISVKTVTIIGGVVFLAFAVVSMFLDPN